MWNNSSGGDSKMVLLLNTLRYGTTGCLSTSFVYLLDRGVQSYGIGDPVEAPAVPSTDGDGARPKPFGPPDLDRCMKWAA